MSSEDLSEDRDERCQEQRRIEYSESLQRKGKFKRHSRAGMIKYRKVKTAFYNAPKVSVRKVKTVFYNATEKLVNDQVVKKLDKLEVLVPLLLKKVRKRITNVLRIMLRLLKDKKTGDRRSRRIYYFVCDIIEITDDALEINNRSTLNQRILSLMNWMKEGKIRMLRSRVDGTETKSGENEEDVVGLEEDVELLLRGAIFHNERCSSTSLITGMLGIGKTTLARQVYNHVAVIDQFQHRGWVCVSSDLSNKEVLMKLIQQVVVCNNELERDSLLEKMEVADNPSLQVMLRQNLQGMRYFIVLDDLPKQMYLESILKALPSEDNGSRLLLTSRTKNIQATLFSYTHEMKTLGSDKSWQLFSKTIFFGNKLNTDKLPKPLEEKGKEILAKCGGLPLAIKEMGMKLAKQRQSGGEWEQLFESIDLGATLRSLELLYHKLDPTLRSCFLHLAFFKENTTMRAKRLVQIWAAGRMLPKFQTASNLHNLHRESIIEVKDKSTYNKIKNCRINSILHTVSITKAEELIGFEVLRNDGKSSRSSHSLPRHRVIRCSREKFSYSTSKDKHLVSLFFHGGGYFDSSPSYWESFGQLRILDLEDFGLQILPESIGALITLRYLGLRNNYIQELPPSLGCLKKLEVLDISLNFLVEAPDIIWEMRSLRHLYMSGLICRKPLKIDTLQNLQTVTYITVDNWTYELSGLQMMTSLRKLGIEELDGNSDVNQLFASLADLLDLEELILRGLRFKYMPCLDELSVLRGLTKLKLDGALASIPSADNFPPNLRYLKLVNTRLDEDPMPVLGKMPKLKCLKLRDAYTGQQMVILHNEFRNLLVLFIEQLWCLRNVQVGEGAMRVLNKLEINNCPYLEALPEEIGSMPNLELTMVTTKRIAIKIRK